MIKSLEESVFLDFNNLDIFLFRVFRNTDMSLRAYDAIQKELDKVFEPYLITAKTLPEFRTLFEGALEETCTRNEEYMLNSLEHENGNALSALEWAEENGIELEIVYELCVFHRGGPDGKTYNFFSYLDFPNLAEKLGYDKAKYIDFHDFVSSNSESTEFDTMKYG
jgi:hypothetical protein